MYLFDMVLLPIGCVLSGLIAAAPVLLRMLPWFLRFVEGLLPFRAPVGIATLLTGVVCLLFPYQDIPLLGSLFPAAVAIGVGLMLSLEYFAGNKKLPKSALTWIGNVLMYLKNPLGLSSIFLGLAHLSLSRIPFV